MTRVNVVPVTELSDKHLMAEYHELPRVFTLIRAAIARGEQPDDPRNPTEYVLGKGHVRFFYPNSRWLIGRLFELGAELIKRGVRINAAQLHDIALAAAAVPPEWWGELYFPAPEALALNRQRLRERDPDFYV